MSNLSRFIQFIPSEEADYLQEHYPNAFLLLTDIAKRARRTPNGADGLKIGEALIGDYKKAGIASERQYRTAKHILSQRNHIKIIETCRNRKKSTTGTTTIGTKVKLISDTVWNINPEKEIIESTTPKTTDRRPTDDRPTTNNNDKNDNKTNDDDEKANASRQWSADSLPKGKSSSATEVRSLLGKRLSSLSGAAAEVFEWIQEEVTFQGIKRQRIKDSEVKYKHIHASLLLFYPEQVKESLKAVIRGLRRGKLKNPDGLFFSELDKIPSLYHYDIKQKEEDYEQQSFRTSDRQAS